VDDKVVCSRSTPEGKTGHVEFNCLLGELTKGTTIYTAVCANGADSHDSYAIDYSIARGVVASIMASSEHKVTAYDVDSQLGHTVAHFGADYPQKNGFTYMQVKAVLTVVSIFRICFWWAFETAKTLISG
jgi:hypothetical protein